jgi:uncharacterized protein YcnI
MTFSFRTRRGMLTSWLVLIAVVVTFVRVPVASAHVTISPASVAPNVYQAFTVDVPTEKTVPTIAIRLEIPAGLRVARFQPKPGWTRTTEKDASGLIVAVTWTGGSIAPDEYEQFVFLARTPKETGPLVFKAFQTYEGGEVVGWTGAELDNFPAAVVQVTDEATADGTAQPPTSIEEPAVTATEPLEATTVNAEATAPAVTAAPATPTPAPSATVAVLPSPLATTGIPPAGAATVADTGSDLGLFVALAALVVAVIGVALAIVGLVRRRGAA